ncbi:helix-turn-helix domain-containing protein, partial [Acinetobacter baumannii]|nr:helix-turn-helix domain-containing protein [Acinetobacter baumannii]
LLGCRLESARGLLAASRRSVADIALACGFADQTSLTRAMRRAFDVTPAAYRRASQESASKAQ